MNLTTWDVRYSIGIDEFDGHHRHLILLLNKIYESFMHEAPDIDLARIFNELTDYTQYHFLAEEALMQDCHYPDFDSHKVLHDQFVKRLKELQTNFSRCNQRVSFELLTFLNSWLLSHIQDTDVKFGKFLAAEQREHAA
jgi:hemerythrin